MLFVKDGIKYTFLKRHHVVEVVPILAGAFTSEPISVMIGGNSRLGWEIVFQSQMDMGNAVVDNGMSVVAIDAATNKICGTFTSMDSQYMIPTFSNAVKQMGMLYKLMKCWPEVFKMEPAV